MNETLMVFLVLALGTWLAAAIGAALVFVIKKENAKLTKLILGFAAGVILVVSFTELIHPAIHRAEQFASLPAWIVVPGAFAFGFLCAFLLDRCISRMKSNETESGGYKYKQGVVLLGALSVHGIPEGLALGVLLGALGRDFSIEGLIAFLPIAIAVGLHKLPEGTAISIAFQKDGMSKIKSFILGQASGFSGFLAGILGFAVALNVNAILPYAMAFAGGAMVWVAVHELIPESRKGEAQSPYLTTIGVFLGVMLMLFVDTTLHNHSSYQCGPNCAHNREAMPSLLDQLDSGGF